MNIENLQKQIKELWEIKDLANSDQSPIHTAIELIDNGTLRAAEALENGDVKVNEWVKKAVLLYFRVKTSRPYDMTSYSAFDKIPLKTAGWTEDNFKEAGFRLVPGSIVRYGSYVAKNVVLMPSFINIGAYVGEGTMVDTWATIGSCAQIGKNCHISGGAGIGGVLEPLQASPVIIGDNCFIGARSEIAEGVRVGDGAVISMGVYIAASTKIYNQMTGEITYGYIPPKSVVIPGNIMSGDGKTSKYAAIIIKQVDSKTLSKTELNEILRNG
ncbi:MAG: 2,3,4,5-tetrahydropyridine-2,6-dicarboxylate N-succinyltransferase [Alphaproteobacteria bacterium]|nr:2,3,4,5-tetrahydropyridine-2,6-dicarboxylate N-succinyltransferase [Alphaproteobacteria bacterium]